VPPIKIIDRGQINEEAYRIILRNSRYPDLLEGDSKALMAAAQRAQERLLEMFDRFGNQTMLSAIRQDQHDTGAMVREKALEIIPEGDYSVRDYLDHSGVGDHWYSFHIQLSRRGDHIVLDSTRSDDQAAGSINFVASPGALGAYFGQHFHQYDPSLLSNHGLLESIDEVHLRSGSILLPEWPAALGCRAHTFTKLKGAVRAVLAQATDGQVMAGTAVYVIVYWRMKDDAGQWQLCTDGIAVGHGARPFADGLDAIYQRHNENYPGEFMEMEYPLRMERYAIVPDSGGPGKYRGGCGVIRDVRLLADTGTFGLRVENRIFPTWGVNGGMGGGTSRVVMNPGTSAEKEVQAFSDDNIWSKEDLVRIYTAGGGGWGDPLEREPHLVNDDVKDGYVTLEAALRDYGVVIDPVTLATDEQGTEAKREEIGLSRGPTKMFHRFNYFDTADEEYQWIKEHFPR
jgi:N-methylhydantoinase B